MLVAAAAVGVATVFAAPFSGEIMPLPCTLGSPTSLLSPGAVDTPPPRSLLCPAESPGEGCGLIHVLVLTAVL